MIFCQRNGQSSEVWMELATWTRACRVECGLAYLSAELYVWMCAVYSKVAFIILSPSTIGASHPGTMRQFELYAMITLPITLMSVATCQASGRLCLFT